MDLYSSLRFLLFWRLNPCALQPTHISRYIRWQMDTLHSYSFCYHFKAGELYGENLQQIQENQEERGML